MGVAAGSGASAVVSIRAYEAVGDLALLTPHYAVPQQHDWPVENATRGKLRISLAYPDLEAVAYARTHQH